MRQNILYNNTNKHKTADYKISAVKILYEKCTMLSVVKYL